MASTNNTNVPLAALATFTGLKQLTTGYSNILVSIKADKLSELTIQQSANGTHWDLHERWTCDPIKSPTGFVCQTAVALPYFRVLLENLENVNMTTLRLVSITNTVSNVRLDVRQDNTLVSGEDALGGKHTLLTDASGALLVVASLSPVDNQDVTVTARSGTGFLSYLTDNVAIATMPAITGTVAVSSMPHLSYLTDNVAVATQPALAFAVDKVDVTGSAVSVSNFPATQPISGSVSVSNLPATQPISGSVSVSNFPATQPVSGTVAVSSQPPLSYLTDNVAVATMPPITGTVAVSSAPYLSYLTSNIAVATQPALAFSTDKVDVTGSSVSVSSMPYLSKATSSIDISGQYVLTSPLSYTTSSITTHENPSSIISFDSGNTVREIKATAGSLQSISVTNDNNSIAYIALYDQPSGGVTPGATTPKAVFVIQKNQAIQIVLHNVAFSSAISYYSATTYNGGTPLTLVYLTALYDS